MIELKKETKEKVVERLRVMENGFAYLITDIALGNTDSAFRSMRRIADRLKELSLDLWFYNVQEELKQNIVEDKKKRG